MDIAKFIAGQRKSVNVIVRIFVVLLTVMWMATLVDWAFSLGWGWDTQILWLGPPMVLFAFLVRLCAMAIFKFVEDSY